MHGTRDMARGLASAIASASTALQDPVQVIICPPAILLDGVAQACAGSRVKWGGQDCHASKEGAFTGNISAPMLKDAGCDYVIVGHSERRQHHGETSAEVSRKAAAAIGCGLIPVICVGETAEERSSGAAEAVVLRQLKESIPDAAGHFLLAYEPVWAIGSGKTPTARDIAQMHAHIATTVAARAPVLYGGSVKAANAAEILAIQGVSGVLVGGASLVAEEFCDIIRAAGAMRKG